MKRKLIKKNHQPHPKPPTPAEEWQRQADQQDVTISKYDKMMDELHIDLRLRMLRRA